MGLTVVAPLPGWNVRGYSYLERQEDGQLHPGADLNVGAGDDDLGRDVVACADGVVVARVDWDGRTYGYGNHVLVAHDLGAGAPADGETGESKNALWSLYAHLDGFDDAMGEGARVTAGQRLGACGKSGWQRWAHLHLELRWFGPESRPVGFWGGRLPVEEISELYADPFTVLHLAPALAAVGDGAAAPAVDVAALQADREYNYVLKMAFEGQLRQMEGRRVKLAIGTVDRLIAGVRR